MRSPDRHERSPGNPDYGSMADQNDRSLASVGDNRLQFVIGGGKPASPRPISLDPLLAEICSLRRRQPGHSAPRARMATQAVPSSIIRSSTE